MRVTRFAMLLMTIAMTLSMGFTASAQSFNDQLDEALTNAEGRYQRIYTTENQPAATPESMREAVPAIGVIILVLGDEEEAANLYNLFYDMSVEDEYDIDDIDDLGDDAALIVEPSPDVAENIVMAREGNVVVMAISSVGGAEPELLQDMIAFTFDHGPADEEVVVNDEGVVTGGWAEAFPEIDEVEGLESYDASPVGLFGMPDAVRAATPAVVDPVEVSTPAN